MQLHMHIVRTLRLSSSSWRCRSASFSALRRSRSARSSSLRRRMLLRGAEWDGSQQLSAAAPCSRLSIKLL